MTLRVNRRRSACDTYQTLLKEAGIAARQDLERLLGRQVHLEMRVRVTAGWRDDEARLKDLGVGDS